VGRVVDPYAGALPVCSRPTVAAAVVVDLTDDLRRRARPGVDAAAARLRRLEQGSRRP
jgi:hypothetical protein